MPANGSTSVRVATRCSNPSRAIAECSVPTGRYRVRRSRVLASRTAGSCSEFTFETPPLCVVWCKPPPGNRHGYRVSSIDQARQKQRKERNSGDRQSEIRACWRSSKFGPPAKPRHSWPFAGVKKPGACPGFRMVVDRMRIELTTSALRTRRSPSLAIGPFHGAPVYNTSPEGGIWRGN